MEFKDKIMLNCFREVKCKQGFTTGIWYQLYCFRFNCQNVHQWPNGQQVRVDVAVQDRFPGGEVMNLLFKFFEGSNEELMGRQQKEEVYGKIWGNAL